MRVSCKRKPRQVAKKIEYVVRTYWDMAKILEEVGDDTELRFTFENMCLTPWYKPNTIHYIMTTRKYGGNTLIAGKLDGGYTKIENMMDMMPVTMPATAIDEPCTRIKIYERFIAEYLNRFNAYQVTLMVPTEVQYESR